MNFRIGSTQSSSNLGIEINEKILCFFFSFYQVYFGKGNE